MQNLEFRAWDKQFKKMSQPLAPFRHGQLFFFFLGIGTRSATHNQLEIFQSIGRKDKYGRQIFGGDIIKIGEDIGYVYFDDSFFAWAICIDGNRLLMHDASEMNREKIQNDGDFWLMDVEIIGTRIENPELLGESK